MQVLFLYLLNTLFLIATIYPILGVYSLLSSEFIQVRRKPKPPRNECRHSKNLKRMKFKKQITVLVLIISITSFITTLLGIFSNDGKGSYSYKTIRGETIVIYGKGLYRHMSADVAIQGIAQDCVTLFIGIPLLIVGLFYWRKGIVKAKFILTGILLYFFLTYLFYTAMAMYNEMFLAYVLLLSCSFFALIMHLISFDYNIPIFKSGKTIRITSYFLLINSMFIALLWLSIVLPPLLNMTIYPNGLEHYTTLIVQGFDLGIFLPLGFVSAFLALKKSNYGNIFTTVYVIFLSILMTALTSKLVFMAYAGANVKPAIFIIPIIALFSTILSFQLLRQLGGNETE